MRIKRIKKLKVNCYTFDIKWDKSHDGGCFNFRDRTIEIGVKGNHTDSVFMVICHELLEIVAIEVNVRMVRPDCDSDYIFVYDHRQHETMANMFSGLVSQFID